MEKSICLRILKQLKLFKTMGSYMRFYLKDKEENFREFMSFRTSSSEIYRTLNENCSLASLEKYNTETKTFETSDDYTEITTSIVMDCLDSLKESINHWKNRITTYYKICGKYDMETACMEITRDEDYLRELESQKAQFEFIYKMVLDIEEGYTDFKGIYAQVG